MSETNVDVVKKIYELGEKGDLAAMAHLFDPEIVVYEADSLPYGGVYRGPEGMAALFQKLNQVLEGFRVKTEKFFVCGDDVAAMIRVTGRGRTTGRAVDMPVMEVWTVKNGRATMIRPFYWDTTEYTRLTTST